MTGKQRAYLRGLANGLEPVAHIGKEGITPTVVDAIEQALEARELIKIQVQKNAPEFAREACGAVCAATMAEPVQCIGNRFIVFRQARKPDNRHIVVPK